VRVATDAAGDVYVADAGNNLIQEFTSAGGFIRQWGGAGTGNGTFNGPQGVATDAVGNVYVVDGNNLIQEFTSAGGFIRQWGGAGTGNGTFNGPVALATDCRGAVYVADEGNNLIQKFGEPGTRNPPCPSNEFSFGKIHKNKHKGTALLTVIVLGPGELVLRGKGLRKQRPGAAAALSSKAVTAAGKVKLLVKTKKGKKRRKLNRRGKVKVRAKVTYTPTNGDPLTKTKRIKLIKRR
jgi:DNA-binding beta-propeller fold protein YncE